MGEWIYNGPCLEYQFSERTGEHIGFVLVATNTLYDRLGNEQDEERHVIDTCGTGMEAIKAMVVKCISAPINRWYARFEEWKKLFEATEQWGRLQTCVPWSPINEKGSRDLDHSNWKPENETSPYWVDVDCLAWIYEKLSVEGEDYLATIH